MPAEAPGCFCAVTSGFAQYPFKEQTLNASNSRSYNRPPWAAVSEPLVISFGKSSARIYGASPIEMAHSMAFSS